MVVLLVLAYPAWYGYHWAKYYVYTYRTYGPAVEGARQYMKSVEQYEQDMRNDQYGGSTPEETLRLFVEALESQDYELAARYYTLEDQISALKNILNSANGGYIGTYIQILKGLNRSVPYSSGKQADIEFFDATGEQVHFEKFRLNSYTQKWKLEE